ncbi:MAG: GMC family oxidoreductase [Devosia sp.]
MAERVFDFIIVGGGSAASVAASRLVGEFGYSVLIIERGPRRTNGIMAMPAGYMKYLAKDTFLEMHRTVAQPQLGGRAPIVPVAKALGGGSAVNAMVYMRGQKEDYDGWAKGLGGNGGEWSYDDILPHFTGMEDNRRFNNRFHGNGGRLKVADPGYISSTTEYFMLAAQGLGHAYNPDFNGERQNGVGIMQHTFGQWGRYRQRSDAKRAFLDPLKRDRRLTIVTEARVDRIIIENGVAVGVAYSRDGDPHEVRAAREVLVAAGTYNSAKLLMLSGIGPADHLDDFQIPVIADLPGVGSNLMDHHEVPVIATTKAKSGYFGQDSGWPMIRNGLQYLLFNSGPVTTTGIESCLFYDPDGGERPTIQLYCAPIVYQDRDVSKAKPTWGVTLTSCVLRPKARGTVRLRSADPAAQPLVDPNFFGDPEDLRLTLASMRHARRLLATEPFLSKIREEILPGRGVTDLAGMTRFAQETVKTNYHPSGSLKMGRDDDAMAVVNSRLKVRGIERLRVIDCSIIPAIPSANTNAIALAIGSKAAQMIAEDHGSTVVQPG